MTERPKPGINQLAFPGMEEGAHPGARALANGMQFRYHRVPAGYPVSDDYMNHRLAITEVSEYQGKGRRGYDDLAELKWATKDNQYAAPGEIAWVGTEPDRSREGLASTLYRVASQMDFGQDTIPVHSPDRSVEGEKWSKKVGGPRPPLGVPIQYKDPNTGQVRGPMKGSRRWKMPEGIHPYEKERALSEKQFPVDKKQRRLFE